MVISQYLCAFVHSLTGPESLQSSFISSRHITITKKFTLYSSPKSVAAREAPTIWATIIRAVTKIHGSPDWRRFSAWTEIRISNKELRREKISNEEKTKKKSATKTWGGKTCCRRRAAPTQAICSTRRSTWSKVFFSIVCCQKCLLPKVFEFIHLPEEDHPRQCQGIQVCCVLAAATIVCKNGTLQILSQRIKYSFKAR